MGDFDASYQIRAGLDERDRAEGDPTPEPPTLHSIRDVVRKALEAAFPAYDASVTAERLDTD